MKRTLIGSISTTSTTSASTLIKIGIPCVRRKRVRSRKANISLSKLVSREFRHERFCRVLVTHAHFVGTSTWNNTVSAVITTHRKLFKSNRKQSGYWTLRSAAQAMDIEDDVKEVVKKSPKKRTHAEMSAPATAVPAPVTPKATKPRGLTEEEVYQLKTAVSPSQSQPRVYYAISLRRKNKPGSEDDLGSPSRRTRSATGGDENEEDDDPMLLDDAMIQIPVPKPWMDRVIKQPLVADTYTIEGPIPIPRWVEVNEDEVLDEDDSPGPSPSKKAKISSPKSDSKEKEKVFEEDGDEDISDARFTALHQPYETLEKRLQKYFVNSQNVGLATAVVNNTNLH